MPHIFGGINRLRHGADGDGFHQIFFGTALNFVQQRVDAFCHIHFAAFGLDFVAETQDKRIQRIQFFGIGNIVDTINKCFGIFSFRNFADKFRHSSVGQQHKFFNQVIGFFRFLEINAQRFAFFIEIEFHFVPLKIDSAVGKTLRAKFLRQAVHHQNFR